MISLGTAFVAPTKLAKIVVYLQPELKAKLERRAEKEHRSVSNMVLALIAKEFEEVTTNE